MANISKSVIDAELRARVFADLISNETLSIEYLKVNDRQYGCILTDQNGVERYVRIGVIVAEEREDISARGLMASEIKAYEDKQNAKAEKAKARAEKAAKDKAKREAQKEKEGE